jgi:hypothetical protein
VSATESIPTLEEVREQLAREGALPALAPDAGEQLPPEPVLVDEKTAPIDWKEREAEAERLRQRIADADQEIARVRAMGAHAGDLVATKARLADELGLVEETLLDKDELQYRLDRIDPEHYATRETHARLSALLENARERSHEDKIIVRLNEIAHERPSVHSLAFDGDPGAQRRLAELDAERDTLIDELEHGPIPDQPSDPMAGAERALDEELASLQAERAAIAPEVVAGDESARERLAAIDARIREITTEQDLIELARAERVRREQQAAAEEADEQREKTERERETAVAVRDTAFTEFRLVAGGLVSKLRLLLEADDAAVALGAQSIRQVAGELAIVAVQDGGVPMSAIEPVRAGRRQPLLQGFPLALPERMKSGPKSAIDRLQPEVQEKLRAELIGGIDLRTLERRYGVSRSSLSRWRQEQVARLQSA